LRGTGLTRLPLFQLQGGHEHEDWYGATPEQRMAAAIHLEGADLSLADLHLAALRSAHLSGANLPNAFFTGATLRGAHLVWRPKEGRSDRAESNGPRQTCTTRGSWRQLSMPSQRSACLAADVAARDGVL
jgi:hypothetical protein